MGKKRPVPADEPEEESEYEEPEDEEADDGGSPDDDSEEENDDKEEQEEGSDGEEEPGDEPGEETENEGEDGDEDDDAEYDAISGSEEDDGASENETGNTAGEQETLELVPVSITVNKAVLEAALSSLRSFRHKAIFVKGGDINLIVVGVIGDSADTVVMKTIQASETPDGDGIIPLRHMKENFINYLSAHDDDADVQIVYDVRDIDMKSPGCHSSFTPEPADSTYASNINIAHHMSEDIVPSNDEYWLDYTKSDGITYHLGNYATVKNAEMAKLLGVSKKTKSKFHTFEYGPDKKFYYRHVKSLKDVDIEKKGIKNVVHTTAIYFGVPEAKYTVDASIINVVESISDEDIVLYFYDDAEFNVFVVNVDHTTVASILPYEPES